MLRKILVATDFSACAQHALERAAEIALGSGAELLLLHVRDEFPFTRPDGSGYVPVELERVQAESAERQLREQAASVHKESLRIVTKQVHGAPQRMIGELAEQEGCQLIVMGHIGRGAVARALLMGSVAERVVRTARVPVMTVPLPQAGATR